MSQYGRSRQKGLYTPPDKPSSWVLEKYWPQVEDDARASSMTFKVQVGSRGSPALDACSSEARRRHFGHIVLFEQVTKHCSG